MRAMRVLVIDSAVEDSSYLNHFNVVTKKVADVQEHNIIDSDLMIIDIGKIDGQMAVKSYRRLVPHMSRRISSGGLLVVFSHLFQSFEGYDNYMFLKDLLNLYKFEVFASSGREIVDGQYENLNEVFSKHRRGIQWVCYYKINQINPILRNKANELISFAVTYTGGRVCLLPLIDDKNRFIEDFLPVLLAELKPNFNYSITKSAKDPSPAWLKDFQIEESEVLAKKIDNKEQEISKLQEERDLLRKELESLDEYCDLLWQSGDWLEFAVKKFFKLLGFECEKVEPIDLVGNYDDREILIEIEGSEKAIKLEKGRQILQRVVEAKNPDTARGILVGNPFRKIPPNERPPEKQAFFVKQVMDLAENRDIALVLTMDMFEVVKRILNKKKVNKQAILKKIFENKGLIRLNQ